MEERKVFDARAFVALGMLFSGLSLPFSGFANHVHQFDAMNATRHAWMAAHNSLGLVFVVFTIWHVLLNRKLLWRHVCGLAARIPTIRREAIAAAAVVALVLLLFVGHAFHLH